MALKLILMLSQRGSEVEVLNIVGVVDVVYREGTHRAATIHANLEFRVTLHMKGTYFLCLRKRFAKELVYAIIQSLIY
uniref:Putative ovule protein n=1 Tax=Solanum chacoense TaxID=4108 RepID=A0A0V0GK63_SOLCH